MIKIKRRFSIDTSPAFGQVDTEADWEQLVQNVCHINRKWTSVDAEAWLLDCRQNKYAVDNPSSAGNFGRYEQHTGKTLREFLAED